MGLLADDEVKSRPQFAAYDVVCTSKNPVNLQQQKDV